MIAGQWRDVSSNAITGTLEERSSFSTGVLEKPLTKLVLVNLGSSSVGILLFGSLSTFGLYARRQMTDDFPNLYVDISQQMFVGMFSDYILVL